MQNKTSIIFKAINNSSTPFQKLFEKYPQIKQISLKEIFDYLKFPIPQNEKINENLMKLKLENFKYTEGTENKLFNFFISSKSKSKNNELHEILRELYVIRIIFISYFNHNSLTFEEFNSVLEKLSELNKKRRQQNMIENEKIEYDVIKNDNIAKKIFESLTINDFLFIAEH